MGLPLCIFHKNPTGKEKKIATRKVFQKKLSVAKVWMLEFESHFFTFLMTYSGERIFQLEPGGFPPSFAKTVDCQKCVPIHLEISYKKFREKEKKCDPNVDYPLEWEICLKYKRYQVNYFNILLSKMKAGNATTISETLDTYFPFFDYDYPSTKCLVKQKSFHSAR